MMDMLAHEIDSRAFSNVDVNVPTMAVVATGFFDEFIAQNRLDKLPLEELSDDRIAHAFQQAELPVELLGDLRALTMQVKTPLAVRSSSLLEDALEHPFAGVYSTKMIPNNQLDPDSRFRRLVEAIKFVYASTHFSAARSYLKTVTSTDHKTATEKMAIILQEVVGRRHGDRFYPDVSGVARSYNFYPTGPARPEDAVASLAFGLGKTIVDGGAAWTFSPAFPKIPRPYGSIRELLRDSQTKFWAVNMGKVEYDPINELEYMTHVSLVDAEGDDSLRFVASTYVPADDRIVAGLFPRGPRVLDFAPILVEEEFPVNNVIKALLQAAEKATGAKVEIEFAWTFDKTRGRPARARLGFLQVRPMAVSHECVTVSEADLCDPNVVVASNMVMGNGAYNDIRDIVFVCPERFSPIHTPAMAEQIDRINRQLTDQHRPFLLIGFGRWGSSHSSLGIPVNWSQISGARVIVEATLPEMDVELSQGSHFFHNLSAFGASYFMVPHGRKLGIDWDWLNRQQVIDESEFVRHVRPADSLMVRVDGRHSRGVILRSSS